MFSEHKVNINLSSLWSSFYIIGINDEIPSATPNTAVFTKHPVVSRTKGKGFWCLGLDLACVVDVHGKEDFSQMQNGCSASG